jgi:hypothetical protein
VSQYKWRKEATCYRFSGVAGLEGYFPLESILRVMKTTATLPNTNIVILPFSAACNTPGYAYT